MDHRPDRLLTQREVASRFGVSSETVRRWTRAGFLRAVRIGRRAIRYREAEVVRVLFRGIPG